MTVKLTGLKAIRERKKLKQDELAQAAGVTVQYISFIECGRSTPSLPVTQAIATALGCTVDELLSPEAADEQPQGQAS